MPIERTASVEDMVGNLWKLGRTPSQAEFEQFFSNIAQVGSQQNLAAMAQAAQAANGGTMPADAVAATGMPRVASLDLLRKLMAQQPAQPGNIPFPGMSAGNIPGMPTGAKARVEPRLAQFAGELHRARFSLFAFRSLARVSVASPRLVADVPLPLNPHPNAAASIPFGAFAPGVAGVAPAVPPSSATPPPSLVPVAAGAAAGGKTKATTRAARTPPAKKAKTAPAGKAKPEPKGKAGNSGAKGKAAAGKDEPKNGGDDDDDDDDGPGSSGDEEEARKTGKTTDEVRRQRRMLSNRESARRSRRRKLELVATLEGQIEGHKRENAALATRLRDSEQRVDLAMREIAALKSEVERLTLLLGTGGGGGSGGGGAGGGKTHGGLVGSSSLQRIASAGKLADAAGAGGGLGGDDSPKGFVPFRSLQSYENLLSLQAQSR
jgi:hypothetical protein